MNGRWFDERQLVAHLADGSEKFKKSTDKKAEVGDESENANENENNGDGEGERLDKFGEWLEVEEKKKKAVTTTTTQQGTAESRTGETS